MKETEEKGIDQEEVKKILAKNDQLWQDKMGQALNQFKDNMKSVQEKYKKEMENQE